MVVIEYYNTICWFGGAENHMAFTEGFSRTEAQYHAGLSESRPQGTIHDANGPIFPQELVKVSCTAGARGLMLERQVMNGS